MESRNTERLLDTIAPDNERVDLIAIKYCVSIGQTDFEPHLALTRAWSSFSEHPETLDQTRKSLS